MLMEEGVGTHTIHKFMMTNVCVCDSVTLCHSFPHNKAVHGKSLNITAASIVMQVAAHHECYMSMVPNGSY
jgi:hypothetical protein